MLCPDCPLAAPFAPCSLAQVICQLPQSTVESIVFALVVYFVRGRRTAAANTPACCVTCPPRQAGCQLSACRVLHTWTCTALKSTS